MKGTTIVLLALVIITIILGAGFKFVYAPWKEKQELLQTSEGGRIIGHIRIAGDNYFGYWIIQSQEFKRQLRNRGYTLEWTDDKADYASRHEKFSRGEYDVIAVPIGTYLSHGQQYGYPGGIPAVISESRGADSIVGYKDRIIPGQDRPIRVNDLNNANLRICYTPDSPSSDLLQIPIVHFALDALQQSSAWRIETSGSPDALNQLKNRTCDAAVLWEPNVTEALAIPGVEIIFGSAAHENGVQAEGMIVDVFVVHRKVLGDTAKVDAFFSAYFAAQAYYSREHESLFKEVDRIAKFPSQDARDAAMDRIVWFDLFYNCTEWFGIEIPGIQKERRGERILDSIDGIATLKAEIGDIKVAPSTPLDITTFDVMKRLCNVSITETAPIGADLNIQLTFTPLEASQWEQLQVLGKLRIAPISFDSGTLQLTQDGARTLEGVAAQLIQTYPTYRILIVGHAAPAFTPEAEQGNIILSQQRADLVRNHLITIYGIHAERIRTTGKGGSEPLQRRPNEGELSYRSRQPRVEFNLLENK